MRDEGWGMKAGVRGWVGLSLVGVAGFCRVFAGFLGVIGASGGAGGRGEPPILAGFRRFQYAFWEERGGPALHGSEGRCWWRDQKGGRGCGRSRGRR
jgi:hypothetical protein